MADSFFGFDTSLSNLNDDEGALEPSEDEYDALNDETFGQDSDELDWEVEHEQLASQLESSRRHKVDIDDIANSQLEASLSQLVLDETDAPQSRSIGSSVWRHDLGFPTTAACQPVPTLKNVCTVEELERQLRQKQISQQQQQQPFGNQNYYQARFPVILQRPPGMQAPVPLPYAPQQSIPHNINQPLNKIIGQNAQINQMGQTNPMVQNHGNQVGQNVSQFMQNANQIGPFQNNPLGQSNLMNLSQNMQNVHQMTQSNPIIQNQLGQNINPLGQNIKLSQSMNQMSQNMNQMGPNLNQLGQNVNPIGQSMNHMAQNVNQLGQSVNHMGPNVNHMGPNMSQNMNQMGHSMNQMGQNMNPMGQNMNQMGQQNLNQIGQNPNQMGQNMNQMGQNMNQMGQNMNQMGQNMNQMGQNVKQMMPNGNQFGQMNQFPHMMGQGQPRMIAPPPGMNMPRQNFNSNMVHFDSTFRSPSKVSEPPMNPQNMIMNQQMLHQKITQSPQMNQNKPINQSPLVNQNMNQSQSIGQNLKTNNQKIEPKMQKSRVYNNSQKNITSQNLVQLIQSTHPMLQYNSYHNASHHPMLNNRSNVFTNNQYNHVFNSQRLNGAYSNNMHMNGDDSSSGSDSDEYAGLMTQREKQWLINIQMLQLNTGTPYIHDFYYTVFLERQASKEKEGVKEAHKANQQNHPFYSGGVKQETHTHTHRERHNSTRHNSTSEDGATPRTYVPTQFENSLGKLQCGSVTAPRKIIDVEVVGSEQVPARPSRASSVASTTNPAEVPRELKRTKQLLLDIEALYLILLRLEELNDPLAISNALILKEREEKQKQLEAAQKEALDNEPEEDTNLFLRNIESVQRRPKQDSPKGESIDKRQVVNLAVNQKPAPVKNLLDEDKEDLINKMFLGLLHSDRLAQMLTVRKGRTLVCRFLCRAPSAHARVRGVWTRVLRALPAAARRPDAAAGLAPLAPHYRKYIQSTTGWTAILESCSLLAEALDPARTPYVLTTSLTLSCVCALVEKAYLLVNTPEATSNERQWSKFLKTLARALKNTTLNVARPIQPLPEAKLIHHIKQLESRSTIEILQRGRTAAEFADLTKNDVSEQLVKHLC